MPRSSETPPTSTPKERAKPQLVVRAPPIIGVASQQANVGGYVKPTSVVAPPPTSTSATPLGLMYTRSGSQHEPSIKAAGAAGEGATGQNKSATIPPTSSSSPPASLLYSKPSSSTNKVDSDSSRSVSTSSSAARPTPASSTLVASPPRQQTSSSKSQQQRQGGGGGAPSAVPRPPATPESPTTTTDSHSQFLSADQQVLSKAHAADYLATCTLQQLPTGPSLSLHQPYDVLEAIVDRLPFEYLSRPSLSTNLAMRAAAAAQEQGVAGSSSSSSSGQGYQSLSSLKYNLLPPELVKNIVLTARDVLMSESLVLQIEAPVVIAGDIHGQFQDLINVFAAEPPCGGKYLSRLHTLNKEYTAFKGATRTKAAVAGDTFPNPPAPTTTAGAKRGRDGGEAQSTAPPRKYLFLGDYVDRGDYSVETMILLLCLKILQPKEVFLLRGNHESATISRTYGFMRECTNKYGHGPGGLGGESIWKTFVEMFMCLPVIALVNNSIFCVHGGIPRDLDSMQRIFAMQDVRPYDTPNNGFLCDLVWCDPEDHDAEYLPNSRRVSYTFNEGALDMFLKRNQLQLVCRAHQVMEHGYGFFPPPRGNVPSTRKLVTIFTASNYVNSFANAGAIMLVDEDMTLHFKVFHPVGLREMAVLDRGVAPEDAQAARLARHRALEVAEGSTMTPTPTGTTK